VAGHRLHADFSPEGIEGPLVKLLFPLPPTFTCIHLPHTCIHFFAKWSKLRKSCLFWQPTQMYVIYGDWRCLQTLHTLQDRYQAVKRPLQNRYTTRRLPPPWGSECCTIPARGTTPVARPTLPSAVQRCPASAQALPSFLHAWDHPRERVPSSWKL
jgi:hypothetical protein